MYFTKPPDFFSNRDYFFPSKIDLEMIFGDVQDRKGNCLRHQN